MKPRPLALGMLLGNWLASLFVPQPALSIAIVGMALALFLGYKKDEDW